MKNKRIVTIALVTLGLIVCAVNGFSDERPLTRDCKVDGIEYLQQEWTDEDRCEFYHHSMETRLVAYDWFIALEDPWGSGKPFAETLDQYGLLPDKQNDVYNPDGLPVGLAKTDSPFVRPPQIGFTCAFCHTGQITYLGKRYRIDGGPSMQQNFKFLRALGTALRVTLDDPKDPERFNRFAEKVLSRQGQQSLDAQKAALKADMVKELARLSMQARIDPVEWGAGRFDALDRGGNMIFHESQRGPDGQPRPAADGQALLGSDNARLVNGPVSVPHLWGAWEKDWVLWNGAIQSPVARAMVEAMSIDTKLQFQDPVDPFPVLVERLSELDRRGQQLQAPPWPKEFPLDQLKAAEGKKLFHGDAAKGTKGLCAGCHVPVLLEKPTPHNQRWKIRMSPLHKIGTDPTTALNWHNRKVEAHALWPEGWKDIVFAVQEVTTRVMAQHRDELAREGRNISSNEWRSCFSWDAKDPCTPGYAARPLDGIWATAPYLHNGSVPSLFELLSPVEERQRCFYVGPGVEFHARNVGLAFTTCDGRSKLDQHSVDFEFETWRVGNSNRGHEFRNVPGCENLLDIGGKDGILGCEIEKRDRGFLVEYLKIVETPRPARPAAAK